MPTGSTAAPPTREARGFHAATLMIGAVALAVVGRGQWFFGDEWDPIAQRSVTGDAAKGLLDPHNEHWSTIAVLVYRAHLSVFGLRTYVPLMVLFVAVTVLTAHLLWRLCLRVGADSYVASVLALCFLLYAPAGADAVFAWNFTFVGTLTCGFAILVLVEPRGPLGARELGIVWALGVLAVMLSGVALTVLGVVLLCLWWSRGWRVALTAVALPAAVYVGWTLGWGGNDQSLLATASLGEVPDAVGTGLSRAIDDLVRLPYVGVIVLVALVAWVAATWRAWAPPRAWAVCSAVGAAAFYVVVAVRRNSPFLPSPTTGRYLWMAFALLVPLLALAATQLVHRSSAVAVAVAALAIALVVVQVDPLRDIGNEARAQKQAELRRIQAAALLARRDAPFVSDVVLPTSAFEQSLTIELVTQLDRDGKLPDGRPGALDLLGARADLQVAFDTAPRVFDDPPARLVATHDVQLTNGPKGCVVVVPTGADPLLVFRASPHGTTAVRIEEPLSAFPAVRVVRAGVPGPEREVELFMAAPYRMRLAAAKTEVELHTGPDVVTVCHVAVDATLLEG